MCRESGLPYLGICLGFQVGGDRVRPERARHRRGERAPSSTRCLSAVISELPDQKKIEGLGGTMRLGAQDVVIAPNSLASFLTAAMSRRSRAVPPPVRGRPELDRAARGRGAHLLRSPPRAADHADARAAPEADKGPTATAPRSATRTSSAAQFHPELTSRPLEPAAVFMGLVAAAIQRARDEAQRVDEDRGGTLLSRGRSRHALRSNLGRRHPTKTGHPSADAPS
jgi:CTP synthase